MSEPRRAPDPDAQLVSDSARPILEDTTANASDLEPPGSEYPEPEYPDPASPGGRRPSYAFTLAASTWYKERYPDKAANLWDALHTDRAPQPAPEPDRVADREAGE
jgi:hypothetical protein